MHERARPWLPEPAATRERDLQSRAAQLSPPQVDGFVRDALARSAATHRDLCVNLNPATNVLPDHVAALLADDAGMRPSLGHVGAKYETGLEAIEEVEVAAMDLACRVLGSRFAEVRIASGSMANLTAFLATSSPGDAIIVPPAQVGGHVTHHAAGAAGLAGLVVHPAPVDASRYSVDVDALAALARKVRPALITLGGSLNLLPHPVAEVRAIADEVGAKVLFDAAHAVGMFAGRQWPSPLEQGAHLLTCSTYKSLGGPPGSLLVTDDPDLAAAVDRITHPGLTANFDAARTAALAVSLAFWLEGGEAYGAAMVATARALAEALDARGLATFHTHDGPTRSHQFAVDARAHGGGDVLATRLRDANLLASGIGLPVEGDLPMPGLRLGVPEAVRWGMGPDDMAELADLLVAAATGDPRAVAARTTAFRRRFTDLVHVPERSPA